MPKGLIFVTALSDISILNRIDAERLHIDPFYKSSLQPAGYDVHLGDWIAKPPNNPDSDAILVNDLDTYALDYQMHKTPYPIQPGEFVLGVTSECITLPRDLVCLLNGKSTLGRLGLTIHQTAGVIDPGFDGYITLEFQNLNSRPIWLQGGMPIGQLIFFELEDLSNQGYRGRYQSSIAAIPTLPKSIPNSEFMDIPLIKQDIIPGFPVPNTNHIKSTIA